MDDRPVIVVVDDEADALSAILYALTRRFGGDYRVVSHRSARTALDDICAIKEKGGEIALVIADQRMPEMTGRDFLGRVRSIMPMAKRALLVDWGDHDASPTILQACALGELDNYLYKPWSPAEVHLYPLISEFLAEWTQIYRPRMELIHIIGDEQSLYGQTKSANCSIETVSPMGSINPGPSWQNELARNAASRLRPCRPFSFTTAQSSSIRPTPKSWTPSARVRPSCHAK